MLPLRPYDDGAVHISRGVADVVRSRIHLRERSGSASEFALHRRQQYIGLRGFVTVG